MYTTNEPGLTSESRQPIRKNRKNIIIGVLAFALLGTAGYLLINNNKTGQVIEQQQAQIEQVSFEKSEIQMSFDESLIRLDSMKVTNADLNNQLEEKNNEIAKTKTEIRSILNKKNNTTAELNRAKELIASLNEKISTMEQDVARLTQENQTLTQDKVVLTQEKEVLSQNLTATIVVNEELSKKVEIASTLNASNITITPINVKNNDKEKITASAKRVDKLVISFDVNNRIAEPGLTDVFVLVTGPDGKLIAAESLGSGSFTTRQVGDIFYTTKLPVDIETATTKKVAFSFLPGTDFVQGNYIVQIYQNGFLIGEGKQELKRGGLFG